MHRELCFVKKNGFNMSMGRGLGRFSFRPNRTRGGHLKHDFRLTERLLHESTMTYRGRSDGLVVQSDRKSSFTRLTRILRLYIRSFFFFSPRQCVAPIALMDKPPLVKFSKLLPQGPLCVPSKQALVSGYVNVIQS